MFAQPKRKLEAGSEGEEGKPPVKRRARKVQLKTEHVEGEEDEEEEEEEVGGADDEACAAHPCHKPTGES